jgi:hypothetical protein
LDDADLGVDAFEAELTVWLDSGDDNVEAPADTARQYADRSDLVVKTSERISMSIHLTERWCHDGLL